MPCTIPTLEHDETGGLKVVDHGPLDDYATAVAEANYWVTTSSSRSR